MPWSRGRPLLLLLPALVAPACLDGKLCQPSLASCCSSHWLPCLQKHVMAWACIQEGVIRSSSFGDIECRPTQMWIHVAVKVQNAAPST